MCKLLLKTIIFIVLPLKTYSTNIEDLRGKLYSHMHELSETEMENTKNKLSQLLSSLYIINRDFNLDKLWVDRARPANNIKFETINGSKNLNNEIGLLKKITDDDKWATFVSDYENNLKDKKKLPFLKFTSIFYVLANPNNKKTLGDLPSTTDYIKILDRLCYEISKNYRETLFGYNNFPTTKALIENGDFLNIIDELRIFFKAYEFYENVTTTDDLLYYDMRPSTSEISLEKKQYSFINDKNDLANEYRKQLEKIIRNRIENLKLENIEFTFKLSKYNNDKYPKIREHDTGYINNDITGIINITIEKKLHTLYKWNLENFMRNIRNVYNEQEKQRIYNNFGIEKIEKFHTY